METRCLIHRWTLFSVAFVVLAAITTTVVKATTGAQSNATSQAKLTSPTTPALQEPVPPDHYDPDDTKTWPDVVTEDISIPIRQRQFTIHFYRSRNSSSVIPAIYACGDGGWRGLAPRTAQELAHIGFVVAGIDSKIYLRDFSSIEKPLTTKQLARDYVDVAKALRAYASLDSGTPVYVYGWSLGAGFAIAVGADVETRSNWAGIISIGLPKQNQLVSGVGGNHSNSNVEAHYGFHSADVLAQVTPLPIVMIQSTTDTASPPKVGRELFASANDPKRFVLLKASNHRFTGAREEFYAALGDAVSWMRETAKNGKP